MFNRSPCTARAAQVRDCMSKLFGQYLARMKAAAEEVGATPADGAAAAAQQQQEEDKDDWHPLLDSDSEGEGARGASASPAAAEQEAVAEAAAGAGGERVQGAEVADVGSSGVGVAAGVWGVWGACVCVGGCNHTESGL